MVRLRALQSLWQRPLRRLAADERGSSLLEFAIVLPLLVVFVVGIYDFSGAFNLKQKIDQAAQEGAILAGAQPMTDLTLGSSTTPTSPQSVLAVADAVFNSLAGSGVLPNANTGTCVPPTTSTSETGFAWTYQVTGCSSNPGGASTNCGTFTDTSDTLSIVINRGVVVTGTTPVVVGSTVTVVYDYDWRFNSVIQLLFPGARYGARTCLLETSSVHNQI
ncbi:MAG: TadE/TadG family type IV pilus assembly protein [Terriglobales bacterium]